MIAATITRKKARCYFVTEKEQARRDARKELLFGAETASSELGYV